MTNAPHATWEKLFSRAPMAGPEAKRTAPIGDTGLVLDVYPVTVGRYREFVDEGGYDDHDLWDDASWEWRLREIISAPRWWDSTESHWKNFGRDDQPVVGVSWYEAMAFCRWAGRRLPTRHEWQAAAQGNDARTYPWGDTWREGLVGNRDVGPRVTWPVGSFPESQGPYGHHDLVANVWQWTLDPWPPEHEETRQRVVVGGAWSSRNEHCRIDHHNAYFVDGRWSHVGFRTISITPRPQPG